MFAGKSTGMAVGHAVVWCAAILGGALLSVPAGAQPDPGVHGGEAGGDPAAEPGDAQNAIRAGSIPIETRAALFEFPKSERVSLQGAADAPGTVDFEDAPHGASPLTFGDGDFKITLGALLQFRYTASWSPGAPNADPTVGFQYRRLRPILRGSGLDGAFRLFIQTEANGDGSVDLLDAWVSHQITDELRFRVGRFNLQYDRELITPAPYLPMLERSTLSNTLNVDAGNRVEGFEFRYQLPTQRLTVTFSEGLGVAGTSFNNSRSDWGVTGRYERMLIGDSFGLQSQTTAPRGEPRSLMFGFAVHQQHLNGLGERFNATTDLTYKHDGFNATIALAAQVGEDRNGAMFGEPEHDWGMVLGTGYYVTEVLEPFARVELATTSDENHPDLGIVTAGLNCYILGQALKVSTDLSVAFNGIGPAFDRANDGFPVTPDGDNRYLWRAQIQMLF